LQAAPPARLRFAQVRVGNVKKSSPKTKRSSAKRSAAKPTAESRTKGATAPARHTIEEILSQPAIWAETFARLHREGLLERLAKSFDASQPWLFVACGSSYYLSQLVSAIWSRNFAMAATAVPASELLFAPEETLRRTGAKQIVFVSRSGETTEVIRAAELLRQHADIRTLGITCKSGSRFEALCTHTFTLPWADEKSTVMTRSFTTILLSLQKLGARLKNETIGATLDALPQAAQPWLDANASRIRSFASQRKFADFVFLGQGAHYWLAQEAALKVTEMSASYAQAYHTLEFRHGPRSITGPETLITYYISDAAEAEEILLVSELKKLHATNLVVVNRATPALRATSDLLIELQLDGPEFARFAVAAIPAHLLGTAVGLRKGLDPDSPKNLTRAVVLGETSVKLRMPANPIPAAKPREETSVTARSKSGARA
jgi:glucosamine--fructose-6-phosphate aminotransferase (isomerizing)